MEEWARKKRCATLRLGEEEETCNSAKQVGFWIVDELRVSWNDRTCKLIHNKCH